jgi:hypothetical protein
MIPAYDDARKDPALHGPALSIYLHLLHDVLDPSDYRPVKQLALATETGFSLRTIESVMSTLIERRYIERRPVQAAGPREYRLVFRRVA